MKFFADRTKKGPGCWTWTGTKHGRGYGQLTFKGKLHLAHRVAWILAYGSIRSGMKICHKCDNPICVRPSHLFMGTQADNMSDMWRKGRGLRGSAVGNSKLTEGDVRRIKGMLCDGKESQYVIAGIFGVSQSQISNINRGKEWRWI